jgi:hypothetical protein
VKTFLILSVTFVSTFFPDKYIADALKNASNPSHWACVIFTGVQQKLNTLRILIRLSSTKVHRNSFRDVQGATRIFDRE